MNTLHTEVYGTGETLVLLHGWAMHSGVWRPFAQRLASNFRVVCVDLPGHGRSDVALALDLPTVAMQLLNELGQVPAYWLGWSMGGLLAIEVARQSPEAVKGLILLASNPCFVRQSDWPGMKLTILKKFAAQLAADSVATIVNFLALQLWGLDEQEALLVALKQRVMECAVPEILTLQQGLMLLENTDLRAELSLLTCPILAIFGVKDALVPVSIAAQLSALNTNICSEILASAGHAPFLSHPTETRELIEQFMRNV